MEFYFMVLVIKTDLIKYELSQKSSKENCLWIYKIEPTKDLRQKTTSMNKLNY